MYMIIKIKDFGFNNNIIIKNLTLEINNQDKILIVGRNGIGKSTLFNVIIEKYRSKIELSEIVSYGYLGKESNINFESTLNKEINLFNTEINFHKYEYLINGLNFSLFKNKRIKNLSQGNKIKAELIFLLSNKNKKIFFFDEPTESLDKESVVFLFDYIKKATESFVIISHDSFFGNNFSNKKYTFENKTLLEYV